jgi:hypothetical protein
MVRSFCIGLTVAATLAFPAVAASQAEPEHVRGQVTAMQGSSVTLKTSTGKTVRLGLVEGSTIIRLSKGSFTEVAFGTYVGSVAVRLDAYSPIIRDSLSWLHQGFELHIVDEALRGIALGHTGWDLPTGSTMSHGWVDDMEDRVISIKYGPTEQDETDVEVARDIPILRMSLGDRTLLTPGAHVFAGADRGGDGGLVAAFVLVGENGIVPPM